MSEISKEEMLELNEHIKNISVFKLNMENASLLLQLEKYKFENLKLTLFRKYKVEDDMYIDKDGCFKSIKEVEE